MVGEAEDLSTYAKRLRYALVRAEREPADLVKLLDVTPQAIKKVLAGKTAEMTATNNAKVAHYLNVSSDWLAVGDGAIERWPFVRLTREQIDGLCEVDRLLAEGKFLQALHDLKPHPPGQLPDGVVVIPNRRHAAAKQRPGGLAALNKNQVPPRRSTDEKKRGGR